MELIIHGGVQDFGKRKKIRKQGGKETGWLLKLSQENEEPEFLHLSVDWELAWKCLWNCYPKRCDILFAYGVAYSVMILLEHAALVEFMAEDPCRKHITLGVTAQLMLYLKVLPAASPQ